MIHEPEAPGVTDEALEQIRRDLAEARIATRRQALLLGWVEDDALESTESTDELTPLPEDRTPSWFANHTRTSPGLSELMSGGPREEDWYFSPSHSESSTRTSSRWESPSSRTTPPSHTSAQTAQSKSSGRSPRIKNTGKVLAPHGTFTSRKVAPASPQTESVSSHESVPALPVDEPEMSEEERAALKKAAKKGDQLAMYRLGWLAHKAESRYSLGAVNNIWGPVE